jgi:hypothetical protein
MITQGDIPFLHAIGERPEDPIAWRHYAAWLASNGEIETSIFLNRDWDMIRRMLAMDWHYICEMRHMARETSDYALRIVEYLLPLIRWQSKCHDLEDLTTGPIYEAWETGNSF